MRTRDPDELTDRERDVLELLRRDFTNEQIAHRLNISLDGAKYHVSHILSKLGVATREEAAALSLEERRRWWAAWPLWPKVAGAATVAAAVAGIVVALSSGDNTITLESGALADDALTRAAIPPAIGRASSPSKVDESPTPTATSSSSPTPTESLVVVGPTTVDVSKLPTALPAPTPTDTSATTGTPTLTPTPCETECSGIEGIVIQGVCPVEPMPPRDCWPPYQATIAIWNVDRTELVLEFTTNERGEFRVPLEPGEYLVEPQGEGNFPAPPPPFTISVSSNHFLYLTIRYESGIL